jgi:hypothetical protein
MFIRGNNGYNGSENGWTLAQSYRGFGRPNRGDWVILPLATAVNGQAIHIVATNLGDAKAGNFLFQMGEIVPAYNAEFENNYRYTGNDLALGALNQIQIGGAVGSESFNPNKFSNWHYDVRGAVITAKAGFRRNIYAPSAVKTGASAWNIYFGGWDGTFDGHNRISMVTTPDSFGTFGTHNLMIDNGGWNHVNNLNVTKDAGLFRMYFTTLPNGSPARTPAPFRKMAAEKSDFYQHVRRLG